MESGSHKWRQFAMYGGQKIAIVARGRLHQWPKDGCYGWRMVASASVDRKHRQRSSDSRMAYVRYTLVGMIGNKWWLKIFWQRTSDRTIAYVRHTFGMSNDQRQMMAEGQGHQWPQESGTISRKTLAQKTSQRAKLTCFSLRGLHPQQKALEKLSHVWYTVIDIVM